MDKARLIEQIQNVKGKDTVKFRIINVIEVRKSVIPKNVVVYCIDEHDIHYKLIMADWVYERLVTGV